MRQILCVIDFSESSAKVLDVAVRIASACHAQLVVLFPYRLIDQSHPGDMGSLKVRLETEAKEKFRILKQHANMEGLPCEFQPEIGFIADRINAYVKKSDVDMVIIGQDQTAETNDIKGFNLQGLISNSKLPFVIVPAEVKEVPSLSKIGQRS